MYNINRYYDSKYDYRYLCEVRFSPGIVFGRFINPWMTCIIDTGAFNTIIH